MHTIAEVGDASAATKTEANQVLDGASQLSSQSDDCEADCVSYAKRSRARSTQLHWTLSMFAVRAFRQNRTPNRRPSFQTEALLSNEDGKLTIRCLSQGSRQFD